MPGWAIMLHCIARYFSIELILLYQKQNPTVPILTLGPPNYLRLGYYFAIVFAVILTVPSPGQENSVKSAPPGRLND